MLKLPWPIIFLLAAPGLVFGAATIFALIHGIEYRIALLVLVTIGVAAVWLAPYAPVRTAFAAGFLAALLAVWLQGAFLELYFENNPDYQMEHGPFGLGIRVWVFVGAPIGAGVAAIVSAFAALVAAMGAKVARRLIGSSS